MFEEIIQLIENRDFETATTKLEKLKSDNNPEIVAKANYLLGYIYTCRENKLKNKQRARRFLLNNLNSDFAQPYAYILYSEIEEDKNITVNYLTKGRTLFPNNAQIVRELLRISHDKDTIVDTIEKEAFTNYDLLKDSIDYLIKNKQWHRINHFIFRIKYNNTISKYDSNYLELLRAYSMLFQCKPEYSKARDILIDVIEKDIDNKLSYSHYLGIIYALINLGDISEATKYFDRLPLNNTICDLYDGPWCIICVEFDDEYKTIFDCITNAYTKDMIRKSKTKCLYALYLYYPSECYGKYRYRKSDIKVLNYSLKLDYNSIIATALFYMYCHFEQYLDANNVFLELISHNDNPEKHDVSYESVTAGATDEILYKIIEEIIRRNKEETDFDTFIFATTAFEFIAERLYKAKQYSKIVALADQLSDFEIMSSELAFECAYSFANEKNKRAENIYKKIIEKEPNNSSSLNNLGVILEKKGELNVAIDYFIKAQNINPNEDLYSNNVLRVQKKIKEIEEKRRNQKIKEIKAIAKDINLNFFEQIGYTDELRSLFQSISDCDMREILLRDLRECTICIATSQDKSATIMCGSIIEALLLNKITESGNVKYNISEIKQGKKAESYPIIDMGLNELLYVADKEKLICKSNYHLSHYVRDYRNVVHPSKEIRTQQSISHENALMMWTVLKQIAFELLG